MRLKNNTISKPNIINWRKMVFTYLIIDHHIPINIIPTFHRRRRHILPLSFAISNKKVIWCLDNTPSYTMDSKTAFLTFLWRKMKKIFVLLSMSRKVNISISRVLRKRGRFCGNLEFNQYRWNKGRSIKKHWVSGYHISYLWIETLW